MMYLKVLYKTLLQESKIIYERLMQIAKKLLQVENTAYIYFDFNPAIITNTTFNINGFVGIENAEQPSIEIYPNPSNGIFTISGLEKGYVSIYSLAGKFIMAQDLAGSTLIDLSQMEPGIYMVKVEEIGVTYIFKKI